MRMKRKDLPEVARYSAGPIAEIWPWWSVLRVDSLWTLQITQALRSSGFIAWSPAAEIWARVPRSRKRVKTIRPILPSFVFVQENRVDEAVVMLARLGFRATVFVFNGERVVVRGKDLEPLQEAETRAQDEPVTRLFPGQKVRVLSGVFHYFEGRVMGLRGRNTYTVDLDGQSLSVHLPGFLLQPI